METNQPLHQTLCDLVEVMHRHGVVNVVLSPGSRSAPLALTFLRSKKFDVYHIVDERAAAYFGLGLAKAFERPTALVCTSGTAAYNYAPAVAEAYFQQIPLLVLTADRPPEWIDQNDNQAIFQEMIYGRHVLQFEQMPVELGKAANSQWGIQKVNEACLTAMGNKRGPVHLNFPFREPFYPSPQRCTPSAGLTYLTSEETVDSLSPIFWQDFLRVVEKSPRIWVLAGSSNEEIESRHVQRFCNAIGAILVADPLSGLHVSQQWYTYDRDLKTADIPPPDLIISFGQHHLSKVLKEYLRKQKVEHHLHIQPYKKISDPFSSINALVQSSPSTFFIQAIEHLKNLDRPLQRVEQDLIAETNVDDYDEELEMAGKLISNLPDGCVLHFGNSTPVRYLLHFNHLLKARSISVYANRGTSGIDGCVSTAVGMAQEDDRLHLLVVGDLSMYYDRNGLWHRYVPENFGLVVVNNQGGGIFKRVSDAKAQPELKEYFVNAQPTNFESLAKEHRFKYQRLVPEHETNNQLFSNITNWERLLLEVVL